MMSARSLTHLTTGDATVTMTNYGAHIIDWTPRGSQPVLWFSPLSDALAAPALRGGIPVCLPWFGKPAFSAADVPAEAPGHGVARTQTWDLVERSEFSTHHRLIFPGSELFPHSFHADLHTHLSSDLIVTLSLTNTDDHSWVAEHAFHTYFAVGELKDVVVTGLEGCAFSQADGTRGLDSATEMHFVSSCDRVYHCDQPVTITDPRLRRRITVTTDGMNSVIVWTPWKDGVEGIADIPDDQWNAFLCVEVGNVWDQAITLEAGQTLTASMRISTADLV